jgi:hypothetical protein
MRFNLKGWFELLGGNSPLGRIAAKRKVKPEKILFFQDLLFQRKSKTFLLWRKDLPYRR